jgi:hypothetical protein
LSGDPNHRWQCDTDGLEHGAGAAGSGGAEAKPSASLVDVGLNELIEIVDDIGPFEPATGSDETVDQFLAQQQSKK